MLTSLSIKNYALINELQVHFSEGLTIITGETGAGKSILLGGLSLVLGKRADLSVLQDHTSKCIIEAEFAIDKYGLQKFFKEEDLDYESSTIIRREILPSGKTRAFINDSPVTLDIVSRLGSKLIDVHSQYQTLRLTEKNFQFKVLDAVAGNKNLLIKFKSELDEYLSTKHKLEELIDFQKEADKELDYNSFLLEELQQAELREEMQEELEATYEKLNNVEEIREKLSNALQLMDNEQYGAIGLLAELQNVLGRLSEYSSDFKLLHERLKSVSIEIGDIFQEIKYSEETTEADPKTLEEVNNKLQQLYNLQKKHGVLDISELISKRDLLEEKLGQTANLDETIKETQLKLLNLEKGLDLLTNKLHAQRRKAIPKLQTRLEGFLKDLGMANAKFDIRISPLEKYQSNGKDSLEFLFSANKGGRYGELKKVASGGELSRIMLSIKAVLSRHEQLPAIVFDEIDTGVSGEISNKMGNIMREMSSSMQVFSITHLPQIAAKGDFHFKVFKEDDALKTATKMKKLSSEERIMEIAEMLGGKDLSEAAIAHAKGLLSVP